jgi:AcrR family transcriptional regulator
MMTTETDLATPERGKHDKELRKRALVEAATAVFAEHGYDAATTREIAERACCSEGLIHRYFGGKRGLLMAIVDAKPPEIMTSLRETAPPRDNVNDEIESLLLYEVDRMWQMREFMRVCVSQAAIDPELGRLIDDHIEGPRVAAIRERLAQHQAAGRIRPDVDVLAIAHTLTGMGFVGGFVALTVFGRDRDEVAHHMTEAACAMVRGISPQPCEGTSR